MSRIRYSKQMLEDVREKDSGWVDFLEARGLLDERMLERDAYIRYTRFKNVSFGELPVELHREAYGDLLRFERGLVYGDAIGEVKEFEFRFEVADDAVIREKAIPYARNER
jgi:hypothetical protein